MCNLYSMTKNQAAIRNLFRVDRDSAGNCRRCRGLSRLSGANRPQRRRRA
jgi:hypothetical protein